MKVKELTPEEKKIVTAMRRAAVTGLKNGLGFELRVGTTNADGHTLTRQDIRNFYRRFDRVTARALLRIRS